EPGPAKLRARRRQPPELSFLAWSFLLLLLEHQAAHLGGNDFGAVGALRSVIISLETYRLHPGLPWVACESFRHRASRFVHRRTPAEPTLAGFCSHRPYLVPLELKAIWISPPLTLVLG